jgi:hypothetical protein
LEAQVRQLQQSAKKVFFLVLQISVLYLTLFGPLWQQKKNIYKW